MKGSNTKTDDPQVAGIGEINVATNEQAVPSVYFAGTRGISLSWLMEPVDQFTQKNEEAPAKK